MKNLSRFYRSLIFLELILGVLCAPGSLFAGDDQTKSAKIEITNLTLFKNGLGFVVSDATLPGDALTIRIGRLPIPSFGTFWVAYPKDVKVGNLVTSMEESETKTPVQNFEQLCKLNAGRRATVNTANGAFSGMLGEWTVGKEPQDDTNPYTMGSHPSRSPYNSYVQPSGTLLTVRTDKGVVVINPSSITNMEFTDGDPAGIITGMKKNPCIRINLEKPAGGKAVTISYLTRGITWTPAYLVDLSDPKIARFSAHAKVINELTDFNDVELRLATGFPNIKFGQLLDPVAKSQTLADFLGALANPQARPAESQYMLNQQAIVIQGLSSGDEGSSVFPAYSTAAEGMVAEDLFFYPVKNFSLKRDETAWLPLFTAEMPYKHIYTWTIGDFLDTEEHYRGSQQNQDARATEEVWHSCRLVNTLSMPLTTAAAEFMTNGEFTGQDVCYYTAPKAETTIRINKALNILAEQQEIEVERKRDAMHIHGYSYDLVKVRGELALRNKIDKAITVEISKELSGEVLESIPNCKDTKTAKGLKQINPKHLLKWEIELTSGGEQKVSYQYQVYIRE